MNQEKTQDWALENPFKDAPIQATELRVDKNGKLYWSDTDRKSWTKGVLDGVYTALRDDRVIARKIENASSYLAKQTQIRAELKKQGVQMFDASRVDIRGELVVGENVTIDVNVIFQGKVEIGDNVTIGPNCVIKDAQIHNGATIEANSMIDSSLVGEGASIGPFARLRPDTIIKEKAKVGNFVELKKSTLGEGSKANHFSYIGDTTVGKKVNIGAGVITANYDGVNKFSTKIGDNAFIGTNSTLVAPLVVKDGGFIAAGSTINREVQSDQLAIARAKQTNIRGWKRPTKD